MVLLSPSLRLTRKERALGKFHTSSPIIDFFFFFLDQQVDSHLGCAFSGLTADAKMLIDRARVESRNHWFTHDRLMPVESIAQVCSSLD